MDRDLPDSAQVVIIGGGIIGCSIAYHLSQLGMIDVVLIEQNKLTSGTTWHAAGLVGQLRATQNLTRLAKYTTELFSELETITGQATGFRITGSISAALNPERFEELKRQPPAYSMRKRCGGEGSGKITFLSPQVGTYLCKISNDLCFPSRRLTIESSTICASSTVLCRW